MNEEENCYCLCGRVVGFFFTALSFSVMFHVHIHSHYGLRFKILKPTLLEAPSSSFLTPYLAACGESNSSSQILYRLK